MTPLPHDLERLLAEEPFVRALAQQLVAREADDVVQQTWLRVLERRPGFLRKPRQWLASVVRNLVADHRRRDHHRGERERAAAPADAVLSAGDLLAIEESRRALVAAVNTLPAPLRAVVILRFYEGLPPRRIAARLGVTPSAISNRLHVALRELRKRLDESRGGRSAWVLALSPLANAPCQLPWRELVAPAAAAGIGVIAMTTKTKLVAALSAVLVVALAFASWPLLREPAVEPTAARERAAPVTAALVDEHTNAAQPAEPPQREVFPSPAADRATTGTILVHVRYGDEPAVASGVVVHAHGDWLGQPLLSAITDGTGTARLQEVPPGRIDVFAAVRLLGGSTVEVKAGMESVCELKLLGGITLTGVVVDARGVPVGGAKLELAMPGLPISSPGVTAADGTFALRECQPTCLIGARAAQAASQTYLVNAKPGSVEHVRIELRSAGGCVAGRIVDRDGAPVAGAVLRVGSRASENASMTAQGGPPLAAQVSADRDGSFVAIGVAEGAQPVLVLAPGFAPWRRTVDVSAGSTTQLAVTLTPGVTCQGTVRSADGKTLPRVDVAWFDNEQQFRIDTRSGDDGSFTLTGLPPGEAPLRAWHEQHGRGSVVVQGADGETVQRDIVLSRGVVLRGRVLDGDGAPLAKVFVHLESSGAKQWLYPAWSDAEGRFVTNNCPADQPITARITQPGYLAFVQKDIDPRAGEVVLRLERDSAPPARIVARVLRADGTPAAGDNVHVIRTDAINTSEAAAVAADGTCTLEVPAGTWRLFASSKDHAEHATEPRRIDAGAVWDLGTIQLDRGGIVRLADDAGPGLECRIVTTDGRRRLGRLQSPSPPQRSDLMNAGDYVLLVRGENVAAHAIPFTIRSGRETVVAVKRTAGVRQRFTFTGVESFELRAGGKHVASAETPESLWLLPGDYTLTASAGDATATVTFTVAAAEGPPVHIEVR